MAIIGARYAFFNDGTTTYSLGKATAISFSMNKIELSELQKDKYLVRSASININSVGGFNNACFNKSGTLRWCFVEQNNNVKSFVVYELENVTLFAPDLSGTSKNPAVAFANFNIVGKCWNYTGISSTTASSAADALSKAQNGWAE